VPLRHHRTVDRIVAICESVARAHRGMALADLAEQLEAPKSSIQELTNGLLATGYLVEHDRRFFLGPSPFVLSLMGNPVAAREINHDDLVELSRRMATNVLVAIQVGDTYVHIDQVGDEPAASSYDVRTRQRRPLLATASGKTILANLSHSELDQTLLTASGGNRSAVHSFLAELPDIRRTGLAYNYGATVSNVYAAATGLYDRRGRFVAAVSVTVGPERADELPALGARLIDEVRQMSMLRGERGEEVHG
jgi:DNA-binding IclR family transcriptional regulator